MLKYHIQTIELTSSAKSIEFTDIPQDFTDLYILTSLRCNSGGTWVDAALRFNDSTTNYSERGFSGNGTSTASFTSTGVVVRIPSPGFTANTFSNDSVYIPNYTGSSAKSVSIDNVTENNGTTSLAQITAGLWNDSSAITKIVFLGSNGDLSAGSTISLYGVKRGDSKETASATGGTVTTSGGYTIHTFNASGTFTVNRDLQAEYLVIAGGGGGGMQHGGGGGAGGYRSSVVGESSGGGATAEAVFSASALTNYTVTVGAGGPGSNGTSTNGGALAAASGSNSVFDSITSTGGGGGGAWSDKVPKTGGSGAGGNSQGAGAGISGAAGTSGQGYSGGGGGPVYSAGGGGGAGAAGSVGPSDSIAGNGGNGVTSSITGSAVSRAGGGGGGVYVTNQPATGGTGGTGGGGNGGWAYGSNITGQAPQNATTNTGGGGGGNGTFNTNSGNGGSGVVIIRYLTP